MNKKAALFSLLLGISCTTFAKKVVVGGSGGNLNYPTAASTLGVTAGDTIAIKPGKYGSFYFGNLKGTSTRPIIITNDGGLVEFVSSCTTCSSYLENTNYVTFTGSGARGIEYGFYFHDLAFRGIQFKGATDFTTVAYAKFERVTDYTMFMFNNVKYDGTAATMVQGMKFLHLSFKKTGTPLNCGNYGSVADRLGVTRGFEVAYCKVDSLQTGDVFRFYKGFDVNIHHNIITNVGLNVLTHNGVVYLKGDGAVHHNYFKNVWGNCIRASGVGLNEVGDIYFYNNLCLGSRKYSGVEVRTLPEDTSSTKVYPYTTKCNYYVYNNTIGNQATNLDVPKGNTIRSVMVDVYDFFGAKCIIKNNLGFNVEKDRAYDPTRNYVYTLQKPNKPDTSNNLYRRSYLDLGLVDTIQCFLKSASCAIDKGATLASVSDDYEGVIRGQGSKYDIGAREATITAAAKPVGTGLSAEYFNNTTLSGTPNLTRKDATVDFGWGAGSPSSVINANQFSVRWTGKVLAPTTDTYTFYATADDGMRLYVNGTLLVDNWKDHATVTNSGTIALEAGKQYDIRYEYYEACCSAEARLSWSTASISKQIVPTSALFPIASASMRMESDFSAETSVEDLGTIAYPVPAHEAVTIRHYANISEGAMVRAFDTFGEMKMNTAVSLAKGENQLPLNIADLAPGVYVLVIKSDSKTTSTKFVVE